MRTKLVLVSLTMAALLLLTAAAQAEPPLYPAATVSIELTGVGAGIGVSWGSGKLRFQGREYRFTVNGLSVGDVGISTVSAVGNVYNLRTVADFPGTYASVGAGISVAGGVSGATMRNQRGVIIDLYAIQQGVQLSIGAQGFTIDMQ